jgi:trimeric autotransporter adhesin
MSRSLFRTPAAIAARALHRRKSWRARDFRVNQPALIEFLEDRVLMSTTEVDVINNSFSPKSVTIQLGDTIHWVWKGSSHSTTSVAAAVLQSIAVTPANPSVPKGESEHFTATGTFSDNLSFDITTQVHRSSSATGVATISNTQGSQGLATALATGNSTVTADLDGVSSSTTLTVSAKVLRSIAVTPANPSLPEGKTEKFTATGAFSDQSTEDLTSQVTWASSSGTVATISNTTPSQGLAKGVGTGPTTISAILDGISGSTTLTVTAAKLVSISITGLVPDVPDGELQVYTATGTLSDNSTEDLTNQVIWASANQSVATISNDQVTRGVATSLSPGTTTITATLGGVTGSAVLTVGPLMLEMIMIMPTNPTIAAGGTESFMAMGMFSDQSLVDYTSRVTWSSSATNVVTISNDAGSQGIATAHGPGTSTISATFDGMTDITSITVTPAPPALVSVVSIHDTLNKRHQVTGITVAFSGALNAPLAQSLSNYRLATPGKKGSFDAKNAKLIKLKSAVYNAALDQVVLTPKKPVALSKPIQLRVNGQSPAGLQDTEGRLIDGNHDGQPGGNAVAVVSRKGVTISAIPVSTGNPKSAAPSMGTMSKAEASLMAMHASSIAEAVAIFLAADSADAARKVAPSRRS